ncbi:hypothetical protein Ari01nite_06880 [Paractinoplanes rishiriensis]|uniref:Uncharacterized protein n=1 Tax=Paractinoplanes rishiriensis TaxID=1050105 RepID=A0A919JR41_9ACTN|nr:hypothetical protein Ari01nite_06880 [Actinoplanes rishiriensis]
MGAVVTLVVAVLTGAFAAPAATAGEVSPSKTVEATTAMRRERSFTGRALSFGLMFLQWRPLHSAADFW